MLVKSRKGKFLSTDHFPRKENSPSVILEFVNWDLHWILVMSFSDAPFEGERRESSYGSPTFWRGVAKYGAYVRFADKDRSISRVYL